MKEILSKIGQGFVQAVHTIKDKASYGISFLITKITRKDIKNGHPYISSSFGQRAGRSAASKQCTHEIPVVKVQQERVAVRATSVSRKRQSAKKEKNPLFAMGFLIKLANKKRFATVVCVAAAAVLVPVIAVAASGATGDTQKEIPVNEIEETAPPQAVNDFVEMQAADAQTVPAENVAAQAEQVAEPTPTPEPEPQYLSLSPEMSHPDVAKLQQRLMELNYMDNDEATEYYGPMTQQAVGYFQRKHEIAMDGAAGPQTQELLFSEAAKPYSVTIGAEGEDIGNIQYRLQELGYDVALTGYFGEDTESKVKYFQRMNGLTDDGSVGQNTKDILFSENAEPSEEYKKAQEQKAESNKKNNNNKSGSKNSSGGSSGGGNKGSSTSHVADPGNVEAMINVALSMEGVPYKRGGKSADGVDCSGLVYYALKESGNSIGYMTSGGWASSGYATVSSLGDLQRGDIICFNGHVGIYLGGGTMVDASSGQGKVVVRSCTGSWSQSNFICGKRPL